MSSMRNPVGPEEKRVYLRRRLLVLAGLLAVVVAVVLVIVKPGSSSEASGAKSVELPADVTEKVPSPKPGAAAADAPPACADGDLLVEAATNQTSYAAGELPELRLLVTNRGDADCTADLGTAGMRFEISSGPEGYWNSGDCQKNPTSLPVVLKPAETLESDPVAWDRTRSAADTCDVERDPVPGEGASYHLFVEAGGVRSAESAQFILQ